MTEALSQAEIERLAARLSANKNPKAFSLEGVDVLFCALIASPTMIGPSGYLPVILGGEPDNTTAFADLKDANDTLSLSFRYSGTQKRTYSSSWANWSHESADCLPNST